MTQVSEDQKFTAISEPDFDFDAVEIPEEGPLTFEFDVEVRPEFDLPQWKGLKLERPTMKIGKAEIDSRLVQLLERFAVLEPIEEPAKANDYVTLGIEFSHDGKKVRTADELVARVRPSLSFRDGNLDGFDKLMVGARAGDNKTAKMTLSKDSESEELRGETIELDIEVLEVKRLKLPAIDAKLLKRVGDFEDEGGLRDAVKSELERQLAYRQNERLRAADHRAINSVGRLGIAAGVAQATSSSRTGAGRHGIAFQWIWRRRGRRPCQRVATKQFENDGDGNERTLHPRTHCRRK